MLGPKNEAKIMHFEKPINSTLAVDVMMIVVMMSRHLISQCHGLNMML